MSVSTVKIKCVFKGYYSSNNGFFITNIRESWYVEAHGFNTGFKKIRFNTFAEAKAFVKSATVAA
jgi:hypothetical protein